MIYRAELLQAGQGGEQKKNTYLLSINSSSMLRPNAPFPACSDPALQHLDKRLGGGSPWGAQKAAAQPLSWGSSCPPTQRPRMHPTSPEVGQTQVSAVLPLPRASSLCAQAELHQKGS